MNRADRENITKDVHAVENAKTEQTAKDAALLLRNDVSIASGHGRHGRKDAMDLVNRTNVYDRADNPNLPKITLIADYDHPQYKTGTKIEYGNGKTVREGSIDTPEAKREDEKSAAKRDEAKRAEAKRDYNAPPAIVTERDR